MPFLKGRCPKGIPFPFMKGYTFPFKRVRSLSAFRKNSSSPFPFPPPFLSKGVSLKGTFPFRKKGSYAARARVPCWLLRGTRMRLMCKILATSCERHRAPFLCHHFLHNIYHFRPLLTTFLFWYAGAVTRPPSRPFAKWTPEMDSKWGGKGGA